MSAAPPPVRFGLLSTAGINRRLLPALAASPAAELAAVSSRDAGTLAAWCEANQIPAEVHRHASYEALLEDETVEAVYNPLPNSLHCEWTERAARAGKHVLCEKPLAVDVAECRRMIATCEAAGVVFMEAFMYRHHPGTHRLKALVDEGVIGDVRLIRSSFCFGLDDPTNVRLSAPLHGGASMDVGCYCISFARMLTGEEPTRAYAAATFGAESGVDETLCGTLSFPSGAVSQHNCSVKSAFRAGADILGSSGTIEVARPWHVDPERHVIRCKGEDVVVEGGGDAYRLEVDVFGHSIRTGAPLPIPPVDGARTMAALVALLQSARTGQAVGVEVV